MDMCSDALTSISILDNVIHDALRDDNSKWQKYNLLAKKDIQFALKDYVSECCRIIWCLLSLSESYVLYPTQFRNKNGLNQKRKIKIVDMEFGMDNYGDLEDNDDRIMTGKDELINKMQK